MASRTNQELRRKQGLAKKLITRALDGFYYFEDDSIEDFIDKMELQFWTHPNRRKMVRGALMGHVAIFNKIADIAESIYESK